MADRFVLILDSGFWMLGSQDAGMLGCHNLEPCTLNSEPVFQTINLPAFLERDKIINLKYFVEV